MARVINIIPENYDGNPRDALGYAWTKLVITGDTVDREKSIPGMDLHISLNECLGDLEEEYGVIAIRNNNGYGWLKKTAETRKGETVDISDLEPVASVNCMWCGGLSATIYAVRANAEAIKPSEDHSPAGDTAEETAYVVHTAEKISLDELDEQYKNHPGWCNKCHSFCYGDCEAR